MTVKKIKFSARIFFLLGFSVFCGLSSAEANQTSYASRARQSAINRATRPAPSPRSVAVTDALDQWEDAIQRHHNLGDSSYWHKTSYNTAPKPNRPMKDKRIVKDQRKRSYFEFGSKLTFHHYETNDDNPVIYSRTYSVSNDVEKDAFLTGLHGAYNWRFYHADARRTWKDIFKKAPRPDYIRIEGDIARGKLDYDSYVTGERDDYTTWNRNVRALFGMDFPNEDFSFIVSPYLGFGYRHHENKAGGWVDYFVYDYAEFPVKQSYYYMPFGFETYKRVDQKYDVIFKAELDVILDGSIRYNASEIDGTFQLLDINTMMIEDVQPRNAKSDLDGGFGLRTSLRLLKKLKNRNIFAEPFIEYWKLQDTKPEQAHAQGVDNGLDYVSVNLDSSAYKPFFEPENHTFEYGVKLGMQF